MLMVVPMWVNYAIFYTTSTVGLACAIILVITFPHRMMQAMKGEPPRRRSTDVNRETAE
jgi:hypothetical protein